jgi:hypothetical protein
MRFTSEVVFGNGWPCVLKEVDVWDEKRGFVLFRFGMEDEASRSLLGVRSETYTTSYRNIKDFAISSYSPLMILSLKNVYDTAIKRAADHFVKTYGTPAPISFGAPPPLTIASDSKQRKLNEPATVTREKRLVPSPPPPPHPFYLTNGPHTY